MNSGGAPSWPSRLLTVAVTLLLAALALRWAVQITESIWQELATIAIVLAGLVVVAFLGKLLWHRQRVNRW
jgi:hypothetical protein